MGKKVDQRDVFISLAPAHIKRVLDIGCGDGLVGGRLVERGCEVIGFETDEAFAQIADQHLTKVYRKDVEELDLQEEKFDLLIYADVLEHLMEPLKALQDHKKLLRENGYILASIPNVRYYKLWSTVIFEGKWDYTTFGLLDRGHIRFFTLLTMKELLEEAGYQIVEMKKNISASRFLRVLNKLLFGSLDPFLTYQYYFLARPYGKGEQKPFVRREFKKI